MAGIGFELKKLFKKKGLFAGIKAYGYAGIICTGPMLLGMLLILGVLWICQAGGVQRSSQDLLVCMITYTLLASLTMTSLFSMVVTRFIADMIYQEREELILPSFFGSCSLMLAIGVPLYGIFLIFSGATLIQSLLCLWLFSALIVSWNAMNYLTAIKDYKGILISFIVAVGVSIGVGFLMIFFHAPAVEGLLIAVSCGYGVMLLFDIILLNRYFPDSDESPWIFLRWMDRFLPLALTGFFTNLGLFAHLIIMWMGTLGVQVKGLFYGAPYYDVPAMLAFLTVLCTTINFVVSVEVNFYPKYYSYYSLFNDGGTADDINEAEEEMLKVLSRELRYTALKQLFLTAAVISLESLLLNLLPLGFNDLMHGYFRLLAVGYGLYAIGNMVMLILLYFTDYKGSMISSSIFAATSTVFTIINIFSGTSYYGMGFLLSAAVFFLVATIRLAKFTKNLPYYILSTQPVIAREKRGIFTKLGEFLEKCKV